MGGDVTLCPFPQGIDSLLQAVGQLAGSATLGEWSLNPPVPGVSLTPPSGYFDQAGLELVEASVAPGFAEDVVVVFQLTTNDPDGCGVAVGSFTVTIGDYAASTSWTGAVSADWFDNDNWTNCVPGPATDATIPDPTSYVNPGNDPVINGFDAQCNRIFIQGNAELTIQGSWQLNVNF
jgi:hypothetical protein